MSIVSLNKDAKVYIMGQVAFFGRSLADMGFEAYHGSGKQAISAYNVNYVTNKSMTLCLIGCVTRLDGV